MPRQKKINSEAELEEFVREVAGDPGARVAKAVGDGATDEKIEKDTSLKLSEIRNILNVLHNCGIVEYNREKNMTSGWFTYTWRINPSRALQNRLLMTKKEYEGMRTKMMGDKVVIYKCPKNCSTLTFDEAMEADFACPACNAKLKFSDGTKNMRELEAKISALEKIVDSKMRLENTATPVAETARAGK